MSTKPPLDPLGVSLENLVKVSLNSSHLFDVLQKVFDAVNANAAELNALKNEMMLKTSMTSLTGQLHATVEAVRQLTESKVQMQSSIDSLVQRASSSESNIEQLSSQVKELEEKCATKEELKAMVGEVDHKYEEHQKTNDTIFKHMQGQIKSLESELDQYKKSCNDEMDKLTKTQLHCQDEHLQIKKSQHSAADDVKAVKAHSDQLGAHIDVLRSDHSHLCEKHDATQQELNALATVLCVNIGDAKTVINQALLNQQQQEEKEKEKGGKVTAVCVDFMMTTSPLVTLRSNLQAYSEEKLKEQRKEVNTVLDFLKYEVKRLPDNDRVVQIIDATMGNLSETLRDHETIMGRLSENKVDRSEFVFEMAKKGDAKTVQLKADRQLVDTLFEHVNLKVNELQNEQNSVSDMWGDLQSRFAALDAAKAEKDDIAAIKRGLMERADAEEKWAAGMQGGTCLSCNRPPPLGSQVLDQVFKPSERGSIQGNFFGGGYYGNPVGGGPGASGSGPVPPPRDPDSKARPSPARRRDEQHQHQQQQVPVYSIEYIETTQPALKQSRSMNSVLPPIPAAPSTPRG